MMKSKVLIISYYWPPAGGIAVQRWLQFSAFLSEWGYDVHVYSPENPSYPLLDEELLKKVPADIKMLTQPIWEPYSLAEKLNPKNKDFKKGQFNSQNSSWLSKLSLFIRGNFFIPDARKFWIKPSVRYLDAYIQQENIQNVISTGPPHSMHLIALELKKKHPKLNWLADFRDPWTTISYHKELKLTKRAQKKHKDLEKEVLCTADSVLAASFTDAEYYKNQGAKNSVSVTNGYQTLLPISDSQTSSFTLSYIGKLEQQRNPEVLWQALEELSQENATFQNDLKIQMVGTVDEEIRKKLDDSALEKNIYWIGFVSYEDSKKYIRNSNVLLISSFETDQSKGIIPGKLFEYLAAQKPIISIGPEDSDVQKILQETQSGKHYSSRALQEIKKYILELYLNWKEGKDLATPKDIEKYSRQNQAKKIVPLLRS